MELKHINKKQKIVKRRSIIHKKIKIWALIYQNSACKIFTKRWKVWIGSLKHVVWIWKPILSILYCLYSVLLHVQKKQTLYWFEIPEKMMFCRATQILRHGATKTKKCPCTLYRWFFGNVPNVTYCPPGLKYSNHKYI